MAKKKAVNARRLSATSTEALHSDIERFLRLSATNDEWMPDSLRSCLHVSTGLESAIRAAAAEGKPIVITGTAGSGKSHLLRAAIESSVPYTVVPDLTEYPERDWGGLFGRSKRVIVAGNEGAFLLGQKKGCRGFAHVIESLHAIQTGGDVPRENAVMVVDAAGFDAAGQHVISSLLNLAPLKDFVNTRCDELTRVCWAMLDSDIVRGRIGRLVENASAYSETDGFTFRQLWQCVADLIVGDATTPWFSRLLTGNTEVSRRIASTFSSAEIALPHIGNRLWHADWQRLEPLFLPEARGALRHLLAAIARDTMESSRVVTFRHLRLLALFGLAQSPIDGMLKAGTELWHSVARGECSGLLQSINRYFAFGLIELGDDLELWIQHDTERRHLKPNVQVSLGTAPATDFELVKSVAIANPPDGIVSPAGSRRLLRHKPSRAVLHVTKDLVEGLVRVRSHRMHDREDIEYDWRLTRFFEKVASTSSRPDKLNIADFDFQARKGRVMKWQVSDSIKRIGG